MLRLFFIDILNNNLHSHIEFRKIQYFRKSFEIKIKMSKKFPQYKGLNLPKVAEEILAFWEDNHIFDKSVSSREGQEPFVFLKDRHLQMVYRVFTM